MAEFESKVHRIGVEPHPNADRLDLAVVGGYRCCVAKGEFKSGDLAAYIPEASICPEWLIAELGLEGRLSGSAKNRVKAVKLRGALSQGLVYPVRDGRIKGVEVGVGDDVTELLELVKYEPRVPAHMSGMLVPMVGATIKYEIENIKKFPDVLRQGEPVVFTEKLHGTWCSMGWHEDHGWLVSSKGVSKRDMVFKLDAEENEKNLYVRAFRRHHEALDALIGDSKSALKALYVLGEIYGNGVQDLHYGTSNPDFAVFDMYVGKPGQGHWVDARSLPGTLDGKLPMVPRLYEGPYSPEALEEHTSGKTALGGDHIREGVVIRPAEERREDDDLGRVILKSVSEAYSLRKGGSEYN